MILFLYLSAVLEENLSRVCGDDPLSTIPFKCSSIFVPRMRGCSSIFSSCITVVYICPAYAGMLPLLRIEAVSSSDLSRVCGDDPS